MLRRWRGKLGRGVVAVIVMSLTMGPVLAAGSTYTVKRGDTLAKIAQRNAIPLDKLMALNGIQDANRLQAGQVLKLKPAETATVSAPAKPEARASSVSPAPLADRGIAARDLIRARAEYARQLHPENGSSIVAAARQFTGTPYVWGGISSRGIDCSGLVVRAMREALGKDVPHHAATLYTMGTSVDRSDLQPGDLVFFNTLGNGVSHVGVWIGNNHFIHASSSRGVTESELTGYFAQRYLGARRLH